MKIADISNTRPRRQHFHEDGSHSHALEEVTELEK